MGTQKYDVAAYVWPSYGQGEPRATTFWPEGYGEWQTVRLAQPKFPGHCEPRKPVWGFVNESDADVMEMQINAAVRHGVNVFIYDWYWYDNRPFLEECLNSGFLGAPNNEQMKFYLMWANHDVNNLWDKRNSHNLEAQVTWEGFADRAKFETICHRVIDKYFHLPNYYKIDGKPVFMIFDLYQLLRGFASLDEIKSAFEWFDAECRRAGFPGVHLQLDIYENNTARLREGGELPHIEIAKRLGFESLSNYQFCQMTNVKRPYNEVFEDIKQIWDRHDSQGLTYFPHVSVGWDNNARFVGFQDYLMTDNTPANVEAAMRAARGYLARHPGQPPLVTVNSWNEWTEGSYLQPDALYGYGYLDAIKKVFVEGK